MSVDAKVFWIERLSLHESLLVAVLVNIHYDALVVLHSNSLRIFKHQAFSSKRTILHERVCKRHWNGPIEKTRLWGPKQKIFTTIQTSHIVQRFGWILKTVDQGELLLIVWLSQYLPSSVISHIKIPKSITSNIPNVLPAIHDLLAQKHDLIWRKVVIAIEVIVFLIISSLSGLNPDLVHSTWVLNIVEVGNISLTSGQIAQIVNIHQQIILLDNSSLSSLTSKRIQLDHFYRFSHIWTHKQVFKAMEREF